MYWQTLQAIFWMLFYTVFATTWRRDIFVSSPLSVSSKDTLRSVTSLLHGKARPSSIAHPALSTLWYLKKSKECCHPHINIYIKTYGAGIFKQLSIGLYSTIWPVTKWNEYQLGRSDIHETNKSLFFTSRSVNGFGGGSGPQLLFNINYILKKE